MLPKLFDYLVKNLIPILCKIGGFVNMAFSALFLPIGCVLLFLHKENTTLIGAVFIVGSIISGALGFILFRFVPRFIDYGSEQKPTDGTEKRVKSLPFLC